MNIPPGQDRLREAECAKKANVVTSKSWLKPLVPNVVNGGKALVQISMRFKAVLYSNYEVRQRIELRADKQRSYQ